VVRHLGMGGRIRRTEDDYETEDERTKDHKLGKEKDELQRSDTGFRH
jgi:hypothetical protein